ncbi:MAG: hypothetical protein HYZ00_07190, partial [Candidatus Hydrogenedentes bacterium]|nr:hypothetical protein [Candidatus Hydrogenedentota bacterium]
LLAAGHYFAFPELDHKELRFLAERRLVTQNVMAGRGPRGVYIADDQFLSIMINGAEHLTMRVVLPGLQPQEAWARLNLIDDTLNGLLDFAYDDRLGYLTSVLAHVGTGLRMSAVLHLPAVMFGGRIAEQLALAEQHRLLFHGLRAGTDLKFPRVRVARGDDGGERLMAPVKDDALYTDTTGGLAAHVNEAEGDLFLLGNQNTLGLSEEEVLFQVNHVATEMIQAERGAREAILTDNPRGLEDRVGRSLGVATGARLLGFSEGLSLLSSLRFGCSTGQIRGLALPLLNEVLLSSQGAHLEMAAGHDCDEFTLNVERANLFRNRFASVDRKF